MVHIRKLLRVASLVAFTLEANGMLSEALIDARVADATSVHFGVSPDGQRALAVTRSTAGGAGAAELLLFEEPSDVTHVGLGP